MPDLLAVFDVAAPLHGLHLPELPTVHRDPPGNHEAKSIASRPRSLPELFHCPPAFLKSNIYSPDVTAKEYSRGLSGFNVLPRLCQQMLVA